MTKQGAWNLEIDTGARIKSQMLFVAPLAGGTFSVSRILTTFVAFGHLARGCGRDQMLGRNGCALCGVFSWSCWTDWDGGSLLLCALLAWFSGKQRTLDMHKEPVKTWLRHRRAVGLRLLSLGARVRLSCLLQTEGKHFSREHPHTWEKGPANRDDDVLGAHCNTNRPFLPTLGTMSRNHQRHGPVVCACNALWHHCDGNRSREPRKPQTLQIESILKMAWASCCSLCRASIRSWVAGAHTQRGCFLDSSSSLNFHDCRFNFLELISFGNCEDRTVY